MKVFFFMMIIFFNYFIFCSYYSIHLERKKVNKSRIISKNIFSYKEKQKFTDLSLTYFSYCYCGHIYVETFEEWKRFTINFDTGSSMLWLPSEKCIGCPNNNRYNPKNFLYSRNLNKRHHISYADKTNVNGTIYSDIISLSPSKSFTAENFEFLNVEYGEKLDEKYDGIMGLGIEKESFSFIETLYKQNIIQSPSFSFFLFDNINSSRLYVGDILNNAYISDLFKGKIKQCFVDKKYLKWYCNLNKTSFYSQDNTNLILFDTGANFNFIPKLYFDDLVNHLKYKMNKNVKEDNEYLFCQCKDKGSFGNIILYFNEENEYIINLDDIIKKIEKNILEEFLAFLSFWKVDYDCFFKIAKYKGNHWTIGIDSLKKSFISFNMDERKISFVQNIKEIINNKKIENSYWINKNHILYKLFNFFDIF